MSDALRLIGFHASVYTWSARIGLAEAGLDYVYEEHNPFSEETGAHPFGRVPVLWHGGERLYETAAILTYLGEQSGQPVWPEGALARARVMQALSVANGYGYWPLVRQVFAQGYFRSLEGLEADAAELSAGLAAAEPVLDAFEQMAAEETLFSEGRLTLADMIIGPMLVYFSVVPEGRRALCERAVLSRALARFSETEAVRGSCPTMLPKGWERMSDE